MHFAGPEWAPVEHAVDAGAQANIPVMVDFGANRPERPLADLVTKKLRPGVGRDHVGAGQAAAAPVTRTMTTSNPA